MWEFYERKFVPVLYLKLIETDCESEAVWFASFIPPGINRRPDIAKQEIKNGRIFENALQPGSINPLALTHPLYNPQD